MPRLPWDVRKTSCRMKACEVRLAIPDINAFFKKNRGWMKARASGFESGPSTYSEFRIIAPAKGIIRAKRYWRYANSTAFRQL